MMIISSPPAGASKSGACTTLISSGAGALRGYHLPAMGALMNTRGRVIANRRAVSREISSACRNKIGGLAPKRPDTKIVEAL